MVAGVIALQRSENPRSAHAAALGMMVAPAYWGQGIGTALMEAILDVADNWLDLKRVELDVNTDNPAGVRLYQKTGFAVEGVRRFHTYGDGRWSDTYFMARLRD
jgi:putative acetyltransferase